MTLLLTSLLIFLAIELMVMYRKDITAFKARFELWKNGGKPYENGLPKYAGGNDPYEDTIEFLKKHEGFRDTAYLDGNGVPTIGYGFTDSNLVNKGVITRQAADRRLRQEVADRESFLSSMKNWDKLNEGSKTALRSYYYNYPAGFKSSTKFMKAWNAGNYAEAIRLVDAGMNDKKNPGLRPRRLEELALLKADPFLIPQVLMEPIINRAVSTAVRHVVPLSQTRARWTGAEDTSPYITGKPMVKLNPIIKFPTLELIMDDTEWEPEYNFYRE